MQVLRFSFTPVHYSVSSQCPGAGLYEKRTSVRILVGQHLTAKVSGAAVNSHNQRQGKRRPSQGSEMR